MASTKRLDNGVLVDLTADEIAAREAQKNAWEADSLNRALKNLREERTEKLKETDFYGNSDVTMSDDMKTYRQNLRDLPAGKDTVDKCDNVTWPTKP